jgi:hypothetical protein
MDRVEQWLRAEGAARRPVAERVSELMEWIRLGVHRFEAESWDQANERHAEEFISRLRDEFPGRVHEIARPPLFEEQEHIARRVLESAVKRPASSPVVLVERHKLKPMARRTTGYNYIFTVPGRSPECLILVAHYDTWRGPGADDNTTGEMIVRQYLLDDLRASEPPPLTHTYILAGSEECGLIGFTSQVLLALGIGIANIALSKGLLYLTALGLAMVPLANFRFGVSGSREYVASLSPEALQLIKSVISVDSVGEGRMYIPESSLGADFVRAFIPFEGYEALNDVLQEGAHLHGIKYNTFIAGGTTDHVSFLEVNSTLRDRLGDWLGCPRWLGCHKHGKRKIPASALVALCPGKASPLVFGGKIHTPNDTPDRIYPEPLGEALRILDYWFHLMHGGSRIREPRDLDDFHYARLFRVHPASAPAPAGPAAAPPAAEYWLALKDAIEPNRRNINSIYRVEVEFSPAAVICSNPQIVDWGVETQLAAEVRQRAGKGSRIEPLAPAEIRLLDGDRSFCFRARPRRLLESLQSAFHLFAGHLERFMGSNTFLTFFGAAYLLATAVDAVMTFLFARWFAFQQWFFACFAVTLPLTVILQLAIVLWLIGSKIPTMIDNNYRHLNRADNLRSLRRSSC